MTTQVLKDFKYLEGYTNLIKKKIITHLWDLIYKPMFKTLNVKAENDSDLIFEALRRGVIIYTPEGFKTVRKPSNRLTNELLKLGAKYDRYNKIFRITPEQIPITLRNQIHKDMLRAQTKLNIINDFLADVELNLDHIIDTMVFHNEIEIILDNVGNQIKKNVKKINIIEPELTDEQRAQIASDYTYNMQYYIKNWAMERIPEMRQKVQKAILEGYREDEVQTMLQEEYRIGANKAKFLAQNETSIMLAELKKSMYSEMGFTEFIWQTILDGRERLLHKQLHGRIFSFNNPPVIDERTGQRGLPGETYNCRCGLAPVKRDSVFFDQKLVDEYAELKNYRGIMKYGAN